MLKNRLNSYLLMYTYCWNHSLYQQDCGKFTFPAVALYSVHGVAGQAGENICGYLEAYSEVAGILDL